MVAPSKILELLPEGYGYVIFTFVDSIVLNMWMVRNVIKARKEYNVQVYICYYHYLLIITTYSTPGCCPSERQCNMQCNQQLVQLLQIVFHAALQMTINKL